MKRIDAGFLIFDLDGTLIDSSEDIAWAANRTIVTMGHDEVAFEEIKKNIGWGVRSLLERLMPDEAPERIEEARGRFLDFYSSHLVVDTRLYPGVDETIRRLSGSKKMAVVTNKPEALARRILDRFGMSGHFVAVLGGDTLPVRKPDPEPVLCAIRQADAAASNSVVIGDSPMDCEAGRAAGAHTIGVSYGFRDVKELEEAGCDVIIDRFPEISHIIK